MSDKPQDKRPAPTLLTAAPPPLDRREVARFLLEQPPPEIAPHQGRTDTPGCVAYQLLGYRVYRQVL